MYYREKALWLERMGGYFEAPTIERPPALQEAPVSNILQIAQQEIGVSEQANPDRVAEYVASVTDQGIPADRPPEPWCADFVSWCYKEAGQPLGETGRGFCSCGRLLDWLDDESFYFPMDELLAEYGPDGVFAALQTHDAINPGCIILFDLNLNLAPDHTGICERFDATGIQTIEGNYSDRVALVSRGAADLSLILGFGVIPS